MLGSRVNDTFPAHTAALLRRYRRQSWQSVPQRPAKNDPTRMKSCEQESEALVVRGLLESAGIDADMTSIDAARDTFAGLGGTIILVREEDADEARRVIEEYGQSAATLEETAELDLNEPPREK
ncbi:MAG: hypothetical protein DMG73_14500 [Acidobacteria bacterium]|nr:MAG: hypothetical protein DMG73_14500 [Acidobacteriota bacterium]